MTAGQSALKELIESRGDCKILRLAFKQVGDDGASELGNLLKTGTCRSLEGLDLSCNSISQVGATHIARALTVMKTSLALIRIELDSGSRTPS
eukprot:768411-Hanusia_phi.AAC.4